WTNNEFPYEIVSQNYVQTGLSAGSYSVTITDSSLPTNIVTGPILFYISSGFSLNISNVIDTTCGQANGLISVNSNSNYGSTTANLYYTDNNGNTNLSQPITLTQLTYDVSNLDSGTYYFRGIDAGGCQCNSQTAIIRNSSNFDFGLFVVDSNSCGTNVGKIYVTGLTGTPPFTYVWGGPVNIQQTTDYATGLTSGNYSCTIQDSTGCQRSPSYPRGCRQPLKKRNGSRSCSLTPRSDQRTFGIGSWWAMAPAAPGIVPLVGRACQLRE
ncbi:MAG: hypothetical protein EBX50_22890, partial [Chitinophagia bacterium]|nr:hypothetical protein [Chitinophagia bacterium]